MGSRFQNVRFDNHLLKKVILILKIFSFFSVTFLKSVKEDFFSSPKNLFEVKRGNRFQIKKRIVSCNFSSLSEYTKADKQESDYKEIESLIRPIKLSKVKTLRRYILRNSKSCGCAQNQWHITVMAKICAPILTTKFLGG